MSDITPAPAPAVDVQNVSIVQLVRDALARVADGRGTKDDVLTAMNLTKRLSELAKEFRAQFEEAAIEFIDKNGDIEDGDTRWYVGREKKTKCLNTPATIDAILQATGGDLDKVASCLSSDPFKHGTTKALLEEAAIDHESLFETTEVPDLKTGKPKRAVKSVPKNGRR